MMKYFIGIVPHEKIYEEVHSIQKQYFDQMKVEPHITLKAQSKLTIDEQWIYDIEQLCRHIKPFYASIAGVKYFGREVLYLSVDSPKLIEMHLKMMNLLQPNHRDIEAYYEGQYFVPHITIAKTTYYSKDTHQLLCYDDLVNISKYINDEILESQFLVDHIWIYKYENEMYQRYKMITLTG